MRSINYDGSQTSINKYLYRGGAKVARIAIVEDDVWMREELMDILKKKDLMS